MSWPGPAMLVSSSTTPRPSPSPSGSRHSSSSSSSATVSAPTNGRRPASRRASEIANSIGVAQLAVSSSTSPAAAAAASTLLSPFHALHPNNTAVAGMTRRSSYPAVNTSNPFANEVNNMHSDGGGSSSSDLGMDDIFDDNHGEGPSNSSSSSYALQHIRPASRNADPYTDNANAYSHSRVAAALDTAYTDDDTHRPVNLSDPLLGEKTSNRINGKYSPPIGSASNSRKTSPKSRYKGLYYGSPLDPERDAKDYPSHSPQNYLRRTSSSVINMLSPSLNASVSSSSSRDSPPNATLQNGHAATAQPAWLKNTLGVSGVRRRGVHPCVLIPVFLLGAVFALSGVFSGTKFIDPETARAVVPAKVASWLSWSSANSSNSDNMADTLSHLPRPAYTHHESGHIFMDQARTSLGTIEHPIHSLIANASVAWENLISRQSKTLEQAVEEYKRRYKRNPPKGFDKWYKFATDNNVVLLDEYDQIHRDILPFLSLSRSKLSERIAEIEADKFTHTFVVQQGKISITGAKKELARASDQADLMKNFVHLLPNVNITMSAHDGPSVLVDWQLREKHTSTAAAGQKISDRDADLINNDPAWFGWNLACPPDSRIQRFADGLETGSLPAGPSFVEDHRATMDLCRNPEWQYEHGFTSWPGPRPRHLQPLFSFSKTTMHSDILCVPLEQFINTPTSDPNWEDKPFDKIIWRGSMTGVWYDSVSWWRSSQRSRLHYLSQAKTGSKFVRFLQQGTAGQGTERVVEREVDMIELNHRYLDAAYVGKLYQCTETDGSCEAVPKHVDVAEGLIWEAQNDYKYIIDTDGNAWSGRFHRLMASNSLVLKSTIFPEWYSDRLIPWYHYVPIKIDYSDLYDVMAFFAGDMHHLNGHDDLAKQIAYQGKDWTQKHWRMSDMEVYCFRLYLEWARITALDQSDVDYVS